MQSVLPIRSAGRVVCAPSRPSPVRRLTANSRGARCTATAEHAEIQASVVKATALTSAVSTLLAAGNVSAAQELADIAAGDSRFGVLATLSLPFFAWVGFNIFGPSIHQLQKRASFRSLVGLSLGLATVLAAQHVHAIELPDVSGAAAQAAGAVTAKRDSRFGILLTLLIPVGGWVLFNITGPALAQIDNMNKKQQGRRGVAGAVGLTAAGLMLAQQADAATAGAKDSRFGILAVLLVPVGGWVIFNILGPALAQLDNMNKRRKGSGRNRGIAGAIGLTGAAALLGTQSADAADAIEAVSSVTRDSRLGLLLTLLIPVGGWVLFNILGPALAQVDNMNNKLKRTR